MSINSINIGFDMESMKCAANKSAKVDFVFDKGTKPYLEDANVFHWCFKLYFHNRELSLKNYSIFTYLLWIFLQKNWTSFSLFSSWSSMNLKKEKVRIQQKLGELWMSAKVAEFGVYTKDDDGSTSGRFFAKDDQTNRRWWRRLTWRFLCWWWCWWCGC